MNCLDEYLRLRHKAEVLPDQGGYDRANGEMNPEIWRRFVELLSEEDAKMVWEPFANPDGRTFQDFSDAGIDLFATSMIKGHEDIVVLDAVNASLGVVFDGVLFHPPYFGSRRFSDDPRDISLIEDEDEWRVAMETAVETVIEHLSEDGVVCAVGRSYRHGGKHIKLDKMFVSAFGRWLLPTEVWMSEPDIVTIFRRKK